MTDQAVTEQPVTVPVRLDIDTALPELSRALGRLDGVAAKASAAAGLPEGLLHLIRLRASQLNGCAYCVDVHTKDARHAGEGDGRIAAVPVWAETPFFTARERAALAFTEAVTTMIDDHVPDAAYAAVAAAYDEPEIAALLAVIVSINAWNAVGVAVRPWTVGSYSI